MELKNCTSVLFVKEAKKSRDFYVDVLGLTVISDFGGQSITFREGFGIWQVSEGTLVSTLLGSDTIENPKGPNRFEIAFETPDIEAVYLSLKASDVKFLHEMHTEVWGQRSLRFFDPDGHLIEVGESMEVFLRRKYEELGKDIQATSNSTFVDIDLLKSILKL